MDYLVWAPAAAAAVLIPLGIYFLPARARIVIDTPTSIARAEVRPLWGIGAALITRALPTKARGTPLPSFQDVRRVGHALMTPGIADAVYAAVKSLHDLNPRVAKFELRMNLADTSHMRVVQTAVQAVLAIAPVAIRQSVVVSPSENIGAELSAEFDVMASPAQLSGIYGRLRSSRATQEFRRRLNRKLKPDRRLPDVQVS